MTIIHTIGPVRATRAEQHCPAPPGYGALVRADHVTPRVSLSSLTYVVSKGLEGSNVLITLRKNDVDYLGFPDVGDLPPNLGRVPILAARRPRAIPSSAPGSGGGGRLLRVGPRRPKQRL